MRKQYKLEIFARDFTFKDFAPIQTPDILFDYLSPEKNTVQLAKINADKGDYVHITDMQGITVAQGIISDIEKSKYITTISYFPLISIFDTDVQFDRAQSGTLETFLSGVITANYITVSDTLQRLPIEVATTSTTAGKLNLKDNIHNLLEIILKCFNYGVVVKATFDLQAKKILIEIGRINSTAVLESSLASVKNIVIGDSYGQLNKITIVNKLDETQTVTYYLHTDGTISTVDENRLQPVFFTSKFIESETFSDDAEAAAKEALQPQAYNNLIELTFPNDSKVVPQMEIGTVVSIDGLESVYTGYEKGQAMTKYVFGVVRIDLTKILKRVIK